ncbi:hypothetical protein SLE2022_034570 [Rubroshorea leprosula]
MPAYYPYPEVPSPSPDGFPPRLLIPKPVAPAISSYPPTDVPAPTPECVSYAGGIIATYGPSFDEFPLPPLRLRTSPNLLCLSLSRPD